MSIIICCLVSNVSSAQANVLPPNQPEQDACYALSICGNKFYTPYSYQGNGHVLDLDQTPCVTGNGGGEANCVWLKVKIVASGTIVFSIIPVKAVDDYDFAVLNITNTTCSNLSASDVVRCNFNANVGGSPGGIIGLSTSSNITSVPGGTVGQPFCKNIDAVAGETYLVMINNFGDDNDPGPSNGFTIDFTGSTAIFAQPPPPAFAAIGAPLCYNTSFVTLPIINQVLCSSVAADGSDFTISPNVAIIKAAGVNCNSTGGYAGAVSITFASPLAPGPYTISAKQGTDGNTLLGLCDSALQLPAGVTFTVGPPIKSIDSQVICYNQVPYVWHGVQVTQGGKNAATVTIPSSQGCDSTITLNLTVSPAPVATSLVKTICAGQVYKLPWNDSAVNTTGIYIHDYNSVAGCDSLISTVTLTVDTASKTTQDFICRDSIKILSIGQDFNNYMWNNGATTPTISVTQPGLYTVTATDGFSCVANDTLNIAIDLMAITLAKNIPLCQGTALVINGPVGFASYLWNDGSTNQSLSVTSPGNYWLLVKDAYICPAADTTNVIAEPLPAGFLPAAITKCFFNTITIKPNSSFNKYIWSTGETAPVINVPAAGTFTLQVTDANGCVGTNTITIIDSACAEYLYLPTAFSPNGDSHNDVFKPVFAGIAIQYSFIVYNRWGHKVFESNNPANGWDGTVNGQPEPPGVYVWICRYQLARLQPVSQKGSVVLVR